MAAGVWLTTCTYPVVAFVIPVLVDPAVHRGAYLTVAETFAAAAECGLFWLAFGDPAAGRGPMARDFAAVIGANLTSFVVRAMVF